MVCWRCQQPVLLVMAVLVLLLAGRVQPQPQKRAPAVAVSRPSSSSSVDSRLGLVESKLGTLETSVGKLVGRLAVVTNNLQNIIRMLAPVLSPVVSGLTRPGVARPAVTRPAVTSPAVTRPVITPVMAKPAVTRPGVARPGIARPVTRPGVARPGIARPVTRPAATTVRPPAPATCPPGYSRVGEGGSSRLCLSGLSPRPLARRAAAARCRATGGRLLQLETNVKFHLVKSLLPDDRQMWVGTTYLTSGKDFFWDSGGRRVQVKVQGRVTEGATCAVLVMFRTAGHLAAQNCRLPRYFVCEKVLP